MGPFMTGAAPFIAAGAAVLLVMLSPGGRRLIGGIAGSAAAGLLALGAVNLSAFFTGVALPFNLFTLLCCGLLGAPGIISLLVMQLFWL